MEAKKWVTLGALIIALMGLIGFLNPTLFHFSEAPPLIYLFRRPVGLPAKFPNPLAVLSIQDRISELPAGDQSAKSYRGDERRSGVDPFEVVPLKLKEVWRFENLNIGIHTASKSTPVVDETGVYVGSDSGWFYAFHLNGDLKWKFHVDGALRGIHSTAILTQNRIYFGAYNGRFYCLNKSNGEVLWISHLAQAGVGATPLFLSTGMVVAYEMGNILASFVVKLDPENGKVLWRSEWLREQTHSSPTFVASTESIYLGDNAGKLNRFDLKDGRKSWSVDLGGPIKSTAVAESNVLYVTSWGKALYAIDAVSGREIWKTKLCDRSQSSPTLVPGLDLLIVGDACGKIYGISKTDGGIRWSQETGFTQHSSALVVRSSADEKSYVAWVPCSKEELCALSPKDGKVLSRVGLPGPLSSVPVAFRGDLYLALNFPGGLVKLSGLH